MLRHLLAKLFGHHMRHHCALLIGATLALAAVTLYACPNDQGVVIPSFAADADYYAPAPRVLIPRAFLSEGYYYSSLNAAFIPRASFYTDNFGQIRAIGHHANAFFGPRIVAPNVQVNIANGRRNAFFRANNANVQVNAVGANVRVRTGVFGATRIKAK